MMSHIKNLIMLILIFPLLAGCEEKQTYAYLMQHPAVLKEEAKRCQAVDKRPSEVTQCEVVMRAADDLMSIITEQQEDPERFGQRILQAQEACEKMDKEKCEEVKILLAVAGLQSPE